MTAWNDGYVVDASYTEQAFPQMTPGWLSFVALLHGQPPIDTTGPLTFMELGCGNGLTSCLVAATHPGASVWGYDFNPAHVARARQYASAAGLTNCTFEEASFEELARSPDAGPSQVDVIALHGVYSWITAENRRHVVEIIRRRLAPGGFAYVSYSVPCGWTNLLPIQEALRLHVAGDRRRSDVAIRSAVATIQQLADDGARSFPLGPREQSYLDRIGAHDPAYVAHEFLGGSFHPIDVLRGRRRPCRRQVHVRRRGRPSQRDRRPDRAARPAGVGPLRSRRGAARDPGGPLRRPDVPHRHLPPRVGAASARGAPSVHRCRLARLVGGRVRGGP